MQAVVLFCRAEKAENEDTQIDIFDGVIEWEVEFPKSIHRAEKSMNGWVEYTRRSFFIPRKDGIFSEIILFLSTNYDIQDHEIIDTIVETLDADVD